MKTDLIVIRLKGFAYEIGGLFLTAFVGVLLSPEFLTLVQNNAGTGLTGSVIVLVVSGLLKHLRNLKVAKELGADDKKLFI